MLCYLGAQNGHLKRRCVRGHVPRMECKNEEHAPYNRFLKRLSDNLTKKARLAWRRQPFSLDKSAIHSFALNDGDECGQAYPSACAPPPLRPAAGVNRFHAMHERRYALYPCMAIYAPWNRSIRLPLSTT